MLAKIILFAPLVGAVISGFGWRMSGEKGAQWVRVLIFCPILWEPESVFFLASSSIVGQLRVGTVDDSRRICP